MPLELFKIRATAQERSAAADLKAALSTILDQCDYTAGACQPTEMVGAVLPREVIALARAAIAKAEGR